MAYNIIRGANQIGGTITEISSDNTCIFVDFGAELSVEPEKSTDEEMIRIINEKNPDAVLFTHIHGDHIGLLYAIPDSVKKIGIGDLARKMMLNIRNTLLEIDDLEKGEKARLEKEKAILMDESRLLIYRDNEPQKVGDIEFTPFRVDHSVCDAYMLRFNVQGKTILHTGDFRNHGREGKKLLDDVKSKIATVPIDVLITEGTMMSRSNEKVMDEKQMEKEALKIMKENKYAFLICSSTNMESLSSFYWATVRSSENGKKRPLIVNPYVKEQLKLFTEEIGEKENKKAFQFYRSFPIEYALRKRLSNGKTQKQHMIDEGFTMMVGTNDYYRSLMEEFREYNPVVIYSMWNGYLDEGKEYANKELISLRNAWKDRFIPLHTSGHATPKTIAEVITLVNPKEAIVPVHTENAKGFMKLNISEELKRKVVFMREKKVINYQKFMEKMHSTIMENSDLWVGNYKRYVTALSSKAKRNDVKIDEPLYTYTTISGEMETREISILRFMGQEVARVYKKRNSSNYVLKISKENAEENKKYFTKCDLLPLTQEGEYVWEKEKKNFIQFFKECDNSAKSQEHTLESLLLTELEKGSRKEKIAGLCYMQPVKFGRRRFQMPTPLAASNHRNIRMAKNGKGGGIDILAREKRGNKSRLNVIELKDEYKENETPEIVMKQAIAYAVFLRDLIRCNEAGGPEWYKKFGFRKYPEKELIIHCTVAMPGIPNMEVFEGQKELVFHDETGDKLQLHLMNIEYEDGIIKNITRK